VPISLGQKITNLNCKHIKVVQKLSCEKAALENVGKSDTFSQFCQHFMNSFFSNILPRKKITKPNCK